MSQITQAYSKSITHVARTVAVAAVGSEVGLVKT